MNFRKITAITAAAVTLISIQAFASFNFNDKEYEENKRSSKVKPTGIHFQSLPKYMKLEVFKHLDPKDLISSSEVDKNFNKFTD